MTDFHREYTRRRDLHQERIRENDRYHIGLGNARLTVVVGALVMWRLLPAVWLGIPLLAFIALVVVHRIVLRRRQLALRRVAFYERGLARMEDRWAGAGTPGLTFREDEHLYADDLDIFGSGGLFELLSTARTPFGERCLARWLKSPAAAEEVHLRQDAVAELRGRVDLREDAALLGDDVRSGLDPVRFAQWAAGHMELAPVILSRVAAVVALANAAALLITGLSLVFLVTLTTSFAVFLWCRGEAERVLGGLEATGADLKLLTALLRRLEGEPFTGSRLRSVTATMRSSSGTASQSLHRLSRLAELVESRRNLFVQVFDIPLLYSIQLAFRVETWRRRHGRSVMEWLEAVGEMEAFLALAGFSDEHPEYPFPEVVPDGGLRIDGDAVGHPLLPSARRISNPVALGTTCRVLLVSGSNMSGKSTYMRSIGINVVLALAGSVVCARALRLTPLSIGTCIRVSDSLQSGQSTFFAEITQLRRVVALAETGTPVLFLFDELLHGTNSADRRRGASLLLESLLAMNALGVVTTHDLALTEIAGPDPGMVANAHFEDRFDDGQMTFDYRLREGVVTRSNALELMRSIGLKV